MTDPNKMDFVCFCSIIGFVPLFFDGHIGGIGHYSWGELPEFIDDCRYSVCS